LLALYAFDFVHNGWKAAFHLVFLFGAIPGAWGFQYGIDLQRFSDEGERDYLERFAMLPPEQVEERMKNSRAFGMHVVLAVLIVFEFFAATGWWRALDPTHNPWPLLAGLSLFAAFFLGIMAWCVGYAIWRLRHG
jgi:hypothetical protein